MRQRLAEALPIRLESRSPRPNIQSLPDGAGRAGGTPAFRHHHTGTTDHSAGDDR
jgi:hypothetical protein